MSKMMELTKNNYDFYIQDTAGDNLISLIEDTSNYFPTQELDDQVPQDISLIENCSKINGGENLDDSFLGIKSKIQKV